MPQLTTAEGSNEQYVDSNAAFAEGFPVSTLGCVLVKLGTAYCLFEQGYDMSDCYFMVICIQMLKVSGFTTKYQSHGESLHASSCPLAEMPRQRR